MRLFTENVIKEENETIKEEEAKIENDEPKRNKFFQFIAEDLKKSGIFENISSDEKENESV